MEDSELFSVISTSSSPENLVEIATEAEPLGENDLYVAESIEVVNTDDSIICLDEDEDSAELLDIPLDLSSISLPVTMPPTLDCSESPSRSHSNDNEDDDFCIIYEKKAPPVEVEILENYISPNAPTKKKHRTSQNPRPSEQHESHYSSQQEVIGPTNTLLDDSIVIVDASQRVIPVTPSVNQSSILNRLQIAVQESTEKKKRKIECGVCFDGPDEIEANGKSVVSTVCGHIFCSECITVSIKSLKHCPQCRKKLTMKQFHAIYV